MVSRLIIFLSLIAVGAQAQTTVFNTTNNVSDLNPERDALSAPAGTIRITANINNGGETLDLSTAALPIPLAVTHRTDGWTSPIAPALETVAAEGRIRWQFTLQPGDYELKATATFANDEFPVVWRYLTITSAPSAAAVINIESNAVQVSAAIITGAVFNASVTNDITNTINVTNDISVGAVSVTNFVQTDISFTNIIENVAFTATNLVQVDPTIIITNLFTDVFDVALDGTIVGKGNDGERTIRPSTNNVADLGTETNQWRKVYGVEILVDNVSLPPIPRATPNGEQQVLIFDSSTTQYYFGGIGYPVPTITGTNVATFTNNYVDSEANALLWIAPEGVTNIAIHAWGGAGGGTGTVLGGAGGYVYAILATVPGTVYEVIVGNGGTQSPTANTVVLGASPGGGNGYNGVGNSQRVGGGGGYSGLRINATTNYIAVAGAGAGAGTSQSGRNGGGIIGQDGSTTGTNVVAGLGATSLNFYGLNAAAGTNATGFGSGGFLQGGHAQTNAFGVGVSGQLGGGGAGWQGGAAGGITAATGNGAASGGGGISYANSAYVTFAYSVRSPTVGLAPVTDLPIYVSGRANGVSNANGQPGLVVIQY